MYLEEKKREQSSDFSLSIEYEKQQSYLKVKVTQENTNIIFCISLRMQDICSHSFWVKQRTLWRVRFSGFILGKITKKKLLQIPSSALNHMSMKNNRKVAVWKTCKIRKMGSCINFKSYFSFSTYSFIHLHLV